MAKAKWQKILRYPDGSESVVIRGDKTLLELIQEKPSGRWDPEYWHPYYEQVFSTARSDLVAKPLADLLETPIIAPDHVRASKDERIGRRYSCEYRTLKDLLFTGLEYVEINYCSDNAYQRLRRSQMMVGDILFAGSGVGAIGRVGIVEAVSPKSCVGDLFIIRNPRVNPHYLYVYLLTEFGQSQVRRIFHGIQSAKISTTEIGLIRVLVPDDRIQRSVAAEYKNMSVYHDKAMEAKKNGDQRKYEKNIQIAEKMLKDLIARTEAVIRGERDDVI